MNKKLFEILKLTTILLVEDDTLLKEVIKELIEPYVSKIYEAENGEDGLTQFNLHQIDLIISDINMVHMSGINMAREIRKLDQLVPIIFITAYDTDENLYHSIALNSKSFLKKPFDKRQLLISMLMAIAHYDESNNNRQVNLHQGFLYDLDTKTLYEKNKVINLTRTEQRLLHLLVNNKNRIVSFEMIEIYTWTNKAASPDTIRNYINKLRNKIYPHIIKNIQGIGYQLALEEAVENFVVTPIVTKTK